MTTIRTKTFAKEMKGIASVQASNTREQDRQNALDAWQAANPVIHKTANPVIHKKKKVEKKKVEKQAEAEDVHPPRAPTWEEWLAFWDSTAVVGPITPDMFK